MQNPVKVMESMREIVPLAKEMISQKPSRGMVKVYVMGTVLAFFGVVFGLVETVCQSLLPQEPVDEELVGSMARKHQLQIHRKIEIELMETSAVTENGAISKQQAAAAQRNTANRLHAS